jgi:hypothetical protein
MEQLNGTAQWNSSVEQLSDSDCEDRAPACSDQRTTLQIIKLSSKHSTNNFSNLPLGVYALTL